MTLILGLDTETTGFVDTGDNRFVEIYAGLWNLDTRELVDVFDQRIHPGRSIPAAAAAVHGITLPMLAGCPEFEGIASDLRAFMLRGAYMVAHNGQDFDGPFLDQEFVRVGLPKHGMMIFDTMRGARWATHNGKSPTLGELCFALGVAYDASKAHGAAYDVQIMMDCFFAARRLGHFQESEKLLAA